MTGQMKAVENLSWRLKQMFVDLRLQADLLREVLAKK